MSQLHTRLMSGRRSNLRYAELEEYGASHVAISSYKMIHNRSEEEIIRSLDERIGDSES